jgi:hypothetical protein
VATVKKRPCPEPGCTYDCAKQRPRCLWHDTARQSLEERDRRAAVRREHPVAKPDREYLARYPDWRYCEGCTSLVPKWYMDGASCSDCARQRRRLAHVTRHYDISPEEYAQLFDWQGGRCFVCGQRRGRRELAVDHDHKTGHVRGLLCSNQEYGCNVAVRRLLGDLPAAARLHAYVAMNPIDRMKRGDPPWRFDI